MERILDIGSGSVSGHQFQLLDKKGVIHVDVRITNLNRKLLDVRCDAHNLPFKDKAFAFSYCSHTLEHVTNPFKALKEIKRVTKRKAIIKVPSITGVIDKEAPSHFFTWSKSSLQNLLELAFSKVEVFETTRAYKSSLQKLPILARTIMLTMHTLRRNELTAICTV